MTITSNEIIKIQNELGELTVNLVQLVMEHRDAVPHVVLTVAQDLEAKLTEVASKTTEFQEAMAQLLEQRG